MLLIPILTDDKRLSCFENIIMVIHQQLNTLKAVCLLLIFAIIQRSLNYFMFNKYENMTLQCPYI